MSSGYRLDEAVLAIQEAATGITTVTKDIDEVKGRQEELLQSIHALNERISNIEQGSTKKEKQIRPFIPLYERSLVRAIYRDLSCETEHFNLDEGFESVYNQRVVSKIINEAKVRSSITEDHVRLASERYFRSLYEDHRRSMNGLKEKHRVILRRLQRKKQKLINRRKTFEKYSQTSMWSSQRKERVKSILQEGINYMSSEDSNSDSDTTDGGRVLLRRPLPWLKSKYSNSLHHLDKLHYASLSKKSKGMIRPRRRGQPSERSAPSKPLSFAIVADENVPNSTLDSSISGGENC